MLRISPDSRPPYAIELIAKGISLFAGSFPLAGANKGKNSEDPSVEQQFLSDPQTYRGFFLFFSLFCGANFDLGLVLRCAVLLVRVDGKLRVATGLAILTVSYTFFLPH